MNGIIFSVNVGGKEFDQFELAADHILEQMNAAPDRAARVIEKELWTALKRVATEMAEKHSTPYPPGTVSHDRPTLYKRSGAGIQSIIDSIRVTGGAQLTTLEGSIAARGYMAMHEAGGTIKATRSKYLTIPLPAAMDSRGISLKPRARDWPNTFVARSRKGNLIIFQRRGKDIVPLYLLKPTVYIRPRLRLKEAVLGELPFFQERVLDAIAAEFTL